jgi:hypothetical protein
LEHCHFIDKSPGQQNCDMLLPLGCESSKEAKMKRKARFVILFFALAVLCLGMSGFFEGEVQAQQKKVTDLEGVKFDLSTSLADNIKAFVGKDMFIHLKSGKTMQGYVKSVGNGLLHLEKLTGKDFYDALVKIEDISAIEAKFREMK